MDTIHCDILIIGASTGGVAAALAASEAGVNVILLAESDWIGGQLTEQGVSIPDEHAHIEYFGATRRYADFRNTIRSYYREHKPLTPEAEASPFLNVGSCWVSKLSFEPQVGHNILLRMLSPYVRNRPLRLFVMAVPTAYTLDAENDTITRVNVRFADNTEGEIFPKYVLDATDSGDVLAAVGREGEDWTTGAESFAMTGEPDAPAEAKPHWVQPFTFPFALEWSPDTAAKNVIEPPHDYAELKELQNYHIKHGAITGLFNGKYPWWTYRRILAAENFAAEHIPADVAMINTAGNDYYGGNIIGEGAGDAAAVKLTLNKAVRVSRGYCYWLQTECPREESDFAPLDNPLTGQPFGYPEMKLAKEIFGTKHGCSPAPYIRESRRIIPKRRILEQEIVVKDFQGNVCCGDNARAAFMPDSVGIGHYALDIHPNGHGEPNYYVPTRPFQIPLGALIPVRLKNLLPACKNIGTTHLTNGASRLHPIEWNIGESSALLAAFCIEHGTTPDEVYASKNYTNLFQSELIEKGIPLHWYIDVPLDHSAFYAVQIATTLGFPLVSETDLLFRPDEPINPETWTSWRTFWESDLPETFTGTRAEAIIALSEIRFVP